MGGESGSLSVMFQYYRMIHKKAPLEMHVNDYAVTLLHGGVSTERAIALFLQGTEAVWEDAGSKAKKTPKGQRRSNPSINVLSAINQPIIDNIQLNTTPSSSSGVPHWTFIKNII